MSRFFFETVIFSGIVTKLTTEYMLEDITAHCFQKHIFSFKVGIKGASAYVGSVYYILNGYAFIGLGAEQFAECLKYCLP